MCGILGIFSTENVRNKMFYGLNCLQHRGQESCGIAYSDGKEINRIMGMGLVIDVFKQQELEKIDGNLAIGHVRYSTAGGSFDYNTQPLMGSMRGEKMAIAHNGNLINYQILRARLEEDGMMFQTDIDTEVILYLITRYYKGNIVDAIFEMMKRVEGAYSLVLMLNDKLIAVRDPNGIRPLVMGRTEDSTVFASENAAIEILGGEFLRDIKPGEVVVVSNDGIQSFEFERKAKTSHCIFEHVYFARNDATLDDINSYMFRRRCGKILQREAPCDVDLIIPVPDSGYPSAIGYSQESGIKLGEGLVKNRYMGRTFIKPTQEEREMAVKLKLNPLSHVVKGKRIALIDDSIVRGTTSKNLIKNLRDAGAVEVHMRITSPPVTHPCYFGINTASRRNLIASQYTKEEIREMIGADSLEFISIEGMNQAARIGEDKLCLACFNGDYPVDPCII
ncbi:MAG: amidophosphoribosyltransferase [Peptostreptococcaceae bacterium]|nr:amidophosphoribosyltransferase [Peptostreptococcaceae bacterium]